MRTKSQNIARAICAFLDGAAIFVPRAKYSVGIIVEDSESGKEYSQLHIGGELETEVAPAEIGEGVPVEPTPASPSLTPVKRGRPRKAVEPAAPVEPKETHIVQDVGAPKAPGGENDTAPDLPIPEDTIPLPDRLAQVATRDGVPLEFVIKFCIERDRLPKTATSDDLRADDAVIGWALTCWGTIRDVYAMRQDAAAKNHPSAPTA